MTSSSFSGECRSWATLRQARVSEFRERLPGADPAADLPPGRRLVREAGPGRSRPRRSNVRGHAHGSFPAPVSAAWPVRVRKPRPGWAAGARARPPRCRRHRAAGRPRPAWRVGRRGGDHAGVVMDLGHGPGDLGHGRGHPRGQGGSAARTSSDWPPIRALRSAGVPDSATHAAVDDHDPVGEDVGLLQVLRGQQHGRAARHDVADRLPDLVARPRVQPGGRLVQEQDSGSPAGWRPGPGGGACRPSTSSPPARRPRPGRTPRPSKAAGGAPAPG